MNSNDCDFDDESRMDCVLCQNLYRKTESYDRFVTAKVEHNCRKYLHTAITENDFRERFNVAECQQQPAICPQCFACALRLAEMDDQLEILQKSIQDFLLTFSLTILHRRTTRINGRQRNAIVELDVSEFPGLFDETDLLINNVEQDPLLVRSPQPNVRFETRETDNELKVKNEDQESTMINENVFLDEDIFLNTSPQSEFDEDESVPVKEKADDSKTHKNKECSNGFQIVLERLQFPVKANGLLIQLQDNKKCVGPTNSLTDEEVKSAVVHASSSCRSTSSLQQNPTICLEGKRFNPPLKRKIVLPTEDPEKPYTCFHCKSAFSQRWLLNRHMRTHTGDKPFKCTVCTKVFSRKEHLSLHIKVHTGEKPFQCSVCPRAFTQPSKLKTHTLTHTEVRPYKCPSCPKSFSQNFTLTRHLRIHTGEKPFQCHVCPRAFTYLFKLEAHSRTHAEENI